MSSQQERELQIVNENNDSELFSILDQKNNSTSKDQNETNSQKDDDSYNQVGNIVENTDNSDSDSGGVSDSEIEENDNDNENDIHSYYKGEINLDSFTFTENSNLYTICVDGVPICYVKDEDTARKKMWDLARIQTFNSKCSGWRTNLVEVGENELHILGSYKFYVVSYDQILKRISYNCVRECVDT